MVVLKKSSDLKSHTDCRSFQKGKNASDCMEIHLVSRSRCQVQWGIGFDMRAVGALQAGC